MVTGDVGGEGEKGAGKQKEKYDTIVASILGCAAVRFNVTWNTIINREGEVWVSSGTRNDMQRRQRNSGNAI
jgi:hypothetical protein